MKSRDYEIVRISDTESQVWVTETKWIESDISSVNTPHGYYFSWFYSNSQVSPCVILLYHCPFSPPTVSRNFMKIFFLFDERSET